MDQDPHYSSQWHLFAVQGNLSNPPPQDSAPHHSIWIPLFQKGMLGILVLEGKHWAEHAKFSCSAEEVKVVMTQPQ